MAPRCHHQNLAEDITPKESRPLLFLSPSKDFWQFLVETWDEGGVELCPEHEDEGEDLLDLDLDLAGRRPVVSARAHRAALARQEANVQQEKGVVGSFDSKWFRVVSL